jgi:hypothetical protein
MKKIFLTLVAVLSTGAAFAQSDTNGNNDTAFEDRQVFNQLDSIEVDSIVRFFVGNNVVDDSADLIRISVLKRTGGLKMQIDLYKDSSVLLNCYTCNGTSKQMHFQKKGDHYYGYFTKGMKAQYLSKIDVFVAQKKY